MPVARILVPIAFTIHSLQNLLIMLPNQFLPVRQDSLYRNYAFMMHFTIQYWLSINGESLKNYHFWESFFDLWKESLTFDIYEWPLEFIFTSFLKNLQVAFPKMQKKLIFWLQKQLDFKSCIYKLWYFSLAWLRISVWDRFQLLNS